MTYPKATLSIKAWAEEDRPREKLFLHGAKVLSQAELLAIILGSGSRKQSAVELAKELLSHYENNLSKIARASVSELCKFDGVGQAKAVSILACMELANRKLKNKAGIKSQINSSYDAYEIMVPMMLDLNYEVFIILLLNRQNKPIKIHQLSAGGVTGTVVDPKMIFKEALDLLASGIILCHNHPSGNLKPSSADIELTRKIKNAAKLLDISILDHLIIAGDSYFSFADEGML